MKPTFIALIALSLCLGGCGKKGEKAAAEKFANSKPGTVLWEFKTGDQGFSSPAIGSDGTVPADGRRVITMKSNSMPLNNDGDTILLVQGKTVRQTVSYKKQQAGNGAVGK